MEVGIPIALLFTVIGVLITALVVMLFMKIHANDKNCQEKLVVLNKRILELEECEKKNYSFRHNFDSVTRGMLEHFETKIEGLEKLMESKFEIIIQTIQNSK